MPIYSSGQPPSSLAEHKPMSLVRRTPKEAETKECGWLSAVIVGLLGAGRMTPQAREFVKTLNVHDGSEGVSATDIAALRPYYAGKDHPCLGVDWVRGEVKFVPKETDPATIKTHAEKAEELLIELAYNPPSTRTKTTHDEWVALLKQEEYRWRCADPIAAGRFEKWAENILEDVPWARDFEWTPATTPPLPSKAEHAAKSDEDIKPPLRL